MSGKRRTLLTLLYAVALLWINLYICRDLFFAEHTGHMNSMHGFWMSIARLASHHGWSSYVTSPGWWPYWDAGMPFESTYAPLIPALTAAWSKLADVSIARAFYSVSGLVHALTPLALFAMSATLSRSPGWSFIAAIAYSLLSPTQLIVPDEAFAWSRIGDARRLYLNVAWDEVPHVASLTMLPLAILFMAPALQLRRFGHALAAGACICLAMLSNAFGLTVSALTILCLLLSLGREQWKQHTIRALLIGAGAYVVASPFMPPSLFPAISRNQQFHNAVHYGPGASTAFAVIVLGCVILWLHFERKQTDGWLRFVAFFAWVMTAIPVLAKYFDRAFLPQPMRYNLEMEMALCLFAAFYARPFVTGLSTPIRAGLALLLISLAAEQIVKHRQYEKTLTMPAKETASIEYRVAQWATRNMPQGRIFLPGSLAQWFNKWSDVPQLRGSSWSTAYNSVHQEISSQLVYGSTPDDLANIYLWLKAYGVQAIAVPGPKSPEFWKAIGNPGMYADCEALWREDDTTICRVPDVPSGLAHVVPKHSLLQSEPRDWTDTTGLRRYASALGGATHARYNGAAPATSACKPAWRQMKPSRSK